MNNVEGIIKAYDIRGKVGSELSATVAEKIGFAFGNWLPEKNAVVVGRDMRPDSLELSQAIIKGLAEQGREVWDIGEVTSDMIYFTVGKFGLAGGAMITASHNPGEYNGIKLCREEAKPVGEESGLFEIRDVVIKNLTSDTVLTNIKGVIKERDVTDDWIEHVLSFIDADELKPLKVAVDAGNGMAGKIFPELEPHVPFYITEMFFELDGTFPNHIANPLDPNNLVDLQKMISQEKCDVGVAFDGDGDRAVLVDEKGEALSGSVMTAILAKFILEKYPNSTVLINAICGRIAEETITSNGGKCIRTRVGHSFIKADMRENNAVFAGEHSGHYYFKENYMADSGLIAATIMLYIMSLSNKPLSQIAAPFRQAYVQITETNFEIIDKDAVLKKIAEVFSGDKQDNLDGLSVNFKDSWFNIRASNTEPLLRLNAEAKTEDELDSLVKKVTAIIGEFS